MTGPPVSIEEHLMIGYLLRPGLLDIVRLLTHASYARLPSTTCKIVAQTSLPL